ncbi:MAG: AAA family ATPase, partial [Candidatus Igneacidithiobacillus chanchocoensis]
AKASATVTLKTRKAKTAEDRAELRDRWQSEAKELGFTWQERGEATEVQRLEMQNQDAMLGQLTEQNSTFDERRIWEKVATEAQGAVSAKEIAGLVKQLQKDQSVVRLERREVESYNDRDVPESQYSTREMLTLEQEMSETAQRMSADQRHQVTDAQLGATLAARPTLSGEQVDALRHITRDAGSLALVRGMAGTGKSFLLDAGRETWEQAGYQVQGVALQGKTAQDLQDSTGIRSQTMHSFLRDVQGTVTEPPKRELTERDIVVIEEAGMIGSRQMQNLLKVAERSGAKIVAVGDHQQLQPIEAGGAFKAIQDRIGAADLTGIRRQREQWMRQAVRDLAMGKSAQALAEMDKAGRLHIAEDSVGAKAELVSRWADSQSPIKE